jgi:hypothetical protein
MRLFKLYTYDGDGKSGMFDNRSYRLIFNGATAGFANRNPTERIIEVVVPADSELGLAIDSGASLEARVLDSNSVHVITIDDGGLNGQKADYFKLFRSGWTEF